MVGTLAAAVALCLSSCGGGTEGTDPSSRTDISPHKLLPVETDTAVVYIRGVVLCDTGWEMGSSLDPFPGPPDDPRLDDTETMLTLYFMPGGDFAMEVPYSTYVDDPTQLDYRGGVAITRNVQLTGGRWWQTSTADNTHNLILGVCFDISDVSEVTDPALVTGRNPEGIFTWRYHGEHICLQLRERSNAPDPTLNSYRFDGYVVSGTMEVEAQRNIVDTSYGSGVKQLHIRDIYNFWTQPAIYFPGEGWVPPEDDPLKIKEEE